jgi:NAD(P)-dependent dehydrogenase (short-subunit alcohol dehydrogenase family)
MSNAVVVGHDSELGRLASNHLESKGWKVFGTSRRAENLIEKKIFSCDLGSRLSVQEFCSEILRNVDTVDLVILSVGQLTPIGHFSKIDFDEWAESVNLNFVNQVFLLKNIVEEMQRRKHKSTRFLTFAGSGTNSAPANFSAYTLSKIALIKSMELFAEEYPEYFFLSLGTGWMRSPIHEQTLAAGALAGNAYVETVRRLKENDFGTPQSFCDFLDWYIANDCQEVSGRNIALQGDDWKSKGFILKLTSSNDSFKLRRKA